MRVVSFYFLLTIGLFSCLDSSDDSISSTNDFVSSSEDSLSEKYFLTLGEEMVESSTNNYSGDAISGDAKFSFQGDLGELEIYGVCFDIKSEEGISSLKNKTYECLLTIGGIQTEGKATITSVSQPIENSMGSDYDIKGTFEADGGESGGFRLSAFVMSK